MRARWFLAVVPLTLALAWFEAPPSVICAAALAAIVPLVDLIGDATEHLASRQGPVAGGLLNSTLNNLPELIIGGVALSNGLSGVVKSSLTGAILANLLVSLGVALIAGGLRHGEQRIDRRRLSVSASMLMICAFCFIVPAVFTLGAPEGTRGLSVEMSVVLLGMYVVNLAVTLFAPGSDTGLLATERHQDGGSEPSLRRSLGVLAVSAVLLALISEALSAALVPTARSLGLSDTFSGIVFLGGIGSLGEILASLRFARQGKPSLVLSATVGSTIQIVLLVAPMLVFAGILLGQPMDLAFTSFEVVAIVLATVITRELIQDGRANWFEGCLLLGVYVILAIGFFNLPN
jgi:Ca2+:H+ antiporter